MKSGSAIKMGEADVQVTYHLSTKTIILKKYKKSREYAQKEWCVFVEYVQTDFYIFYGCIV